MSEPDLRAIHQVVCRLSDESKSTREATERIEACLIGTMENPGGLVARVAKVEATAGATAREWRRLKKWVWGALGAGIIAGGGLVKAVGAALSAGAGPPPTQGP